MRTTFILALLIVAGGLGAPAAAKSTSLRAQPIAPAVSLGSKWGVVTSVRRSPEHNRAVGGAPNSYHLRGRAIDIARRPGVRHSDLEAAYRKAGYSLVESLDEGDHSHFAFGVAGSSEKPRLPNMEEFASNDAVATPKCDSSLLQARRRPDRFDGCEDAAEPTSGLKPLKSAE